MKIERGRRTTATETYNAVIVGGEVLLVAVAVAVIATGELETVLWAAFAVGCLVTMIVGVAIIAALLAAARRAGEPAADKPATAPMWPHGLPTRGADYPPLAARRPAAIDTTTAPLARHLGEITHRKETR